MDWKEQLKRNPQVIVAAASIICLCFPWLQIPITSFRYSGFALYEYHLGITWLILIPLAIAAVGMLAVPFFEKYRSLLTIGLSAVGILGANGICRRIIRAENGQGWIQRGYGFWFYLLCYLAVVALVLWPVISKSKNEKTGGIDPEALKQHLSINTEEIREQVTNVVSGVISTLDQMKSMDEKECPNCHTKVEDDDKFCSNCGYRMKEGNICGRCQALVPGDSKFCHECGAPMEGSEEAGSVSEEAGSVSEEAGSVSEEAGSVSEDAGSVSEEVVSEEAGSVSEEAGSASEEEGGAWFDEPQVPAGYSQKIEWQGTDIYLIETDKKRYLDLLLLADPQEEMIDLYLEGGDLFTLYEAGALKTVAVVAQVEPETVELKNLATYEAEQRKGYASRMVSCLFSYYQERCETMLVGTGDTPETLGFYEKCGFSRSHILENFFTDHYDEPIFEDGKQLVDMIYLKKEFNKP